MSLTTKEKIAIAQQIKNELPGIEYKKDTTVVRIYEIDKLCEFVYNIYNRGIEVGIEKNKKKLKRNLKRAINRVLK